MSDETKPASKAAETGRTSSAAPNEASPPKADYSQFSVGGVAPMAIMKGGTSRGSYDKEMAKKNADAEARRAHQDRQEQAVLSQDRGTVASMSSRKMVDQSSPRLVLQYLNKDKTVRQECISEITHVSGQKQGELDTMFSLVCPKCLERGVPQGECQLFVRDSHRKFSIDERKRGPVFVESPFGNQVVVVCGTVTCHDKIKCSNYNCEWAVRIDDSKVYEV